VNEPRIIAVGEEPEPVAESESSHEEPRRAEEPRQVRSRSPDRFPKLNEFVDRTLRDLSRVETKVWMVLYRDERNGTVQTAQSDIARRAGCSPRAVVTALKRLKGRGLVEVVKQGGLNRGMSIYRIHSTAQSPEQRS